MIIDLDAHQGNGHEMDFADDSMAKKNFSFLRLPLYLPGFHL